MFVCPCVSQGNIFGWTLDANGSAYVPTLTLRPADSQPLAVGFGTSISLSDSFIISGTPLFNGAFVRDHAPLLPPAV